MKLGVCAQVLYDRPFEDALMTAAKMGFATIELPVDARNPFIDLDACLAGGWRDVERAVQDAGLEISALSNHQEGQLLLGPHGVDTDAVHAGSPVEKVQYAQRRLLQTAELAELLGVEVVCGFTGCEDYARFFPWPLEDGYERMAPDLVERLVPVLDGFHDRGVRFAHECHPKQFAYDLETALWMLELVDDHPALGFNLDPANLMLAGVDPVVFASELGPRILHVHAKDGEKVRHHVARSGLLAHGRWDRPDRGFRFRVPGWGQIDWRALISELRVQGYDGVLSVEHEDPTMSRHEGLLMARRHLDPLLLHEPVEQRWW